MAKIVPHCLRFDWQITVFACFLTRCSAGINIAINNAMIAITTNSSINVKPFALRITFDHLFQREIMSFAGMFVCHDYNTINRGKASCWLNFMSWILIPIKPSSSYKDFSKKAEV
jgi:hypothetical protein